MGYSRLLMNTSPMMYGDDVREVQGRLSYLEYNVGSLDGWFGGQTESAVRTFQSRNSLDVDGIVGPNTWNRLFSSAAIRNGSGNGGIDNGKAAAQDYRNWGYGVFENASLGPLRNSTFAVKNDTAIALCLYLGNAKAVCSTVSGARSAANELLNMYGRYYNKSFPVSRDGLALELMYHAIPSNVINTLKDNSNILIREGINYIDYLFGLTTSFYWADSGVSDKLRPLDKVAKPILDLLALIL